MLKDESRARKYIKEIDENWSDGGGLRYRMVIAYVAINEINNAINFMKYFEEEYEGCGGCYFLIARILIHFKTIDDKFNNSNNKNNSNNELLNQLFTEVNQENKYVWNIMESEDYIPDAQDQYGYVTSGGKLEANNIVETSLKCFQQTPGAMQWLRSKLTQ